MSELARKAAEMKQARQQETVENERRWAQIEREREERREISRKRAAEFVELMQAQGIPTVPMFVREIKKVPNSLAIYPDEDKLVGHRPVGNGWIIQEEKYDYDHPEQGMWLGTDLNTYLCGELIIDGPVVRGESAYVELQSRRMMHDPNLPDDYVFKPDKPDYDAPYADPGGLDYLANAAIRLGAI